MTTKNEREPKGFGTLSPRAVKPRSRPVPDEAFFRRVRELRERAGLSQSQVAEALGIPKQTYVHFEKRSPLSAALIVPFADLVGADVRYLLTGERPKKHRAA